MEEKDKSRKPLEYVRKQNAPDAMSACSAKFCAVVRIVYFQNARRAASQQVPGEFSDELSRIVWVFKAMRLSGRKRDAGNRTPTIGAVPSRGLAATDH